MMNEMDKRCRVLEYRCMPPGRSKTIECDCGRKLDVLCPPAEFNTYSEDWITCDKCGAKHLDNTLYWGDQNDN